MADDDTTIVQEEVWTYGGTRVTSDVKSHAWALPDGSEITFTDKPKMVDRKCSVGAEYRVKAIKDNLGETTGRRGEPQYIGATDDTELRQQLWAAHWAAETRLASLRQERAVGQRDAVVEALEPLKELAAGMRTRADRAAFIAYVVNELNSAWRK